MTYTSERERQRIEHLVLGRRRPDPVIPTKPRGLSKQEWKLRKAKLRDAGAALCPGVEERVQLRETWGHRQGTPETHEHVYQEAQRPGSLARLFGSGAVDKDQLAAAEAILGAYRMVTAAVAPRTAKWGVRIDGSTDGQAEGHALGGIVADLAYDWWRRAVGVHAEAVLAVIVHDVGLTIVARRHGMSMPRARRMLTDALDLWWVGRGRTKQAAHAAAQSEAG